jgi:hypothetical protein
MANIIKATLQIQAQGWFPTTAHAQGKPALF